MTLRLGRFAGITVDIHYAWLLVVGLFVYSIAAGYFNREFPWIPVWMQWFFGLLVVMLFAVSLVAHEFVRNIMAVRSGIPPDRIRLFAFGGTSEVAAEPVTPVQDLKLAVAGPLFSLLMAGFGRMTTGIFAPDTPGYTAFIWFTAANALIAGLSLLPAYPLDGGRILRAGIWMMGHDLRQATFLASQIGQYSGWLMMALGVLALVNGGYVNGAWLALLGWFVSRSAANSYHNLVFRSALKGLRVEDLMTYRIEAVNPSTTLESLLQEHFLKTYSDAYPVSNEYGIQGIVTVREIRAVPRSEWASVSVGSVMRPIDTELLALAEEDAWDGVKRLFSGKQDYMVVVRDRDVLGLVNREDAYRSLVSRSEIQV